MIPAISLVTPEESMRLYGGSQVAEVDRIFKWIAEEVAAAPASRQAHWSQFTDP